MKILEIVHRFPPATGGSEKVVYELSKNFVRMGHRVTVVTSSSLTNDDSRGFSTGQFFSLKNRFNVKEYENMHGIEVWRFPPVFQIWTFAVNPLMKQWLKENISLFDIVHVHGYQTYEAMMVSRVATANKIPYVHTAHDIVAHYKGILGLFKTVFDHIFGKIILKNASKLIALTPENENEYNDVVPCEDNIVVLPNGIDEPEDISPEELFSVRSQYQKFDKIILFVGRVVKYKGCQFIIRALPDILIKHPNTLLLVVGEDQGYAKDLRSIASSLGVNGNICFTGRVNKVSVYYSIADVFVFPSSGEGFGLSPVEAMRYGVPCILADAGGLKYVLQEVGGKPINMKGDISGQISCAVLEILKEGYKPEDNFNDCLDNLKQFSWSEISARTLDVLKMGSDPSK